MIGKTVQGPSSEVLQSRRYVLLTGGELRNKGAQAMSFITISEIKKRFPELEPILISSADSKPDFIDKIHGKHARVDGDNLAFQVVYGGTAVANAAFLEPLSDSPVSKIKVLRNTFRITELRALYRQAAFCLDISGFAFGDKWGFKKSAEYLRRIQLAQYFDVPVFLMPQSFGPFNFVNSKERESIEKLASDVLKYPVVIFARENEGFEAIKNLSSNANVMFSNDLVLQNREIDLQCIFKQPPISNYRQIETRKNVGIVPNMRNMDHGNREFLMHLYQDLVTKFLKDGYEVYLMRHAREDISLCNDIKEMFPDNEQVIILGEDRYCFEYEEIFSKCDFLVASRYHSIVHAYKCGTPCISLGWATKYRELLELFDQSVYAFDATDENLDKNAFFEAVDQMEHEHNNYRKEILTRLRKIQQNNVFDLIETACYSLI